MSGAEPMTLLQLMKQPIHIFEMVLAAAGMLIALGVATYFLKKNGLITFGKPIERRSCPSAVKQICGDHVNLSTRVVALKSDIEVIKEDQAEVRKSIASMDEKLDNILMHYAIKNGVDLRR